MTLARGGSIAHSGQGWSVLSSAALALDIRRAHAARDRVLLTIFSESTPVLHSVASAPSIAGGRLARQMARLLRGGGFDGVDLDLEGDSTADRAGFVRFVASFSSALKALNATWTIMLDTYPTSAFDPLGFFDVKALLPHVDELFVMAYEMQDNEIPSPTAPLTNASLDDAMTLAEYASVVPARRIVLGIPLYGYDFPASASFDGADATGPPSRRHLCRHRGCGAPGEMGSGDRDPLDGVQESWQVAPDLVRRSGLDRPQVRALPPSSPAPASASGSSGCRAATRRSRPRSPVGARR